MDHAVRYTRVDGLNLAYQVVGDGPIDLAMVDEWATPLEGRWDVPAIAGRLNRLASFARLISFDKRGIGLSDTGDPSQLATPELWVRDLVAVVDAVGSERPVILGAHEGGPIALMYAASLPRRTDSLILVNTGPRLLQGGPHYPFGVQPENWRPDLKGIVDIWESGGGSESLIGATAHDPWWRHWYARSRRQQATPAAGLALMRVIGQVDVRHIVAAITAPTLIVHRVDNGWWPVGGARWLAGQLRHSSLVELDGTDNYWWSGDADAVVDEIEQFLLGERVSEPSHRELATMVFTDLVDSTQWASQLGDREWGKLLDIHDTAIVAEVERRMRNGNGSPCSTACDADRAMGLAPEHFTRWLTKLIRSIRDEGRPSTAEEQKKASRLNMGRRRDGMWWRAAALHHLATNSGTGPPAKLGIGFIVDAQTFNHGTRGDHRHSGHNGHGEPGASGHGGPGQGDGGLEVRVAQTWAGDDYDPSSIKRLACDADWYAILINQLGHPNAVGRTRRVATQEQRRALRALYRNCPLDGTPFDYCDLHHVNQAYEHGGPTVLDNLVPISKAWHHKVHDRGRRLTMHPDRSLELHRPNGQLDRKIPAPKPLTGQRGYPPIPQQGPVRVAPEAGYRRIFLRARSRAWHQVQRDCPSGCRSRGRRGGGRNQPRAGWRCCGARPMRSCSRPSRVG